jgi:hypothetical protein
MATLKTVSLDSKTVRKLAGNLLKLRFRMQQEPSMFEKIKEAQKNDDSIPSLIAKPRPDEVSRIIGSRHTDG